MNGIVLLVDADVTCGRKAATLGVLLRAGLPVPDGLVAHPTAPGWEQSLAGALGDGPFAVRSSATFEDGAEFSFAGQLRTVLSVDRQRVVEAVQLVAASVREPGVRAYAAAQGVALPDSMPVLVQEMVSSEAAGVLFADPALGRWTIEAAPGLGDSVVDGRVTPERWVIDGQDRPSVQRHGPEVLTEAVVTRLCDLSEHVVEVIDGGPQDIEWAMTPGRLWLLQSRPITRPVHATGRALGRADPGALSGLGVSPGRASGAVRVVRNLDDLRAVQAGDVMVCRTTSPAMTAAMLRASAVVTETGGLLCHAAIVARETGIPAIVGVTNATVLLADIRRVEVDGTTGAVTPLADGGRDA